MKIMLTVGGVEKKEIAGTMLFKLEKPKSGKRQNFILRILLTGLCNEGKLEPGKYLISLSR